MSLTLRRAKHITIVIALVGSLLSLITIPAQAVSLTCAQGGACIVGDTGSGGGKVFYVASGTFTQTGATGAMCSTYCKYLEAAPTSGSSAWTDADYAWSGNTNTLIGASAQGTAIGNGYANTLAIVGQSSGGNTAGKAGTASRAYLGPNGKTDWFLPSKDELHELRLQRTVTAANGFGGNKNYWSSTEISATNARYLYFDSETLFTTEHSKSLASGIAVRPIRAFGSAPYDGTNGVVSCGTSGAFTILNNAVSANASSANASCVGSVTIPEGVTSVNNSVFYQVSGVTSVSLPSTLLTIGSSAFRTTSISTIRIPASITSIGDLAFSINAVAVSSLTFDSPSSLTTIGNYVFQYSDFSTVTIPASVTSMGTDVFNANTVLTSIYFLGSKPGGSTSSIYGAASINVYVTTAAAAGFGATWLGAAVSSPPAAPTSLSATAGDGQVSIAFTAGSNNGSTITNYKYSTDGTTYTAFSPSDTTTPVIVTGLTNGTPYTIRIKAVNAAGDGTASSSVTATPVAPIVTYEITLAAGTSGSGSNQTLTKTNGVSLTLPDSATANGYFTRAGYSVTGWSTTDLGSQTHTLGGAFTTEAITTLYAQWTPIAPAFTLSAPSGSTTTGSVISSYSISSTGGVVASYSISPAISNGTLSFSTSTGLLSGTPSTAAGATTYTITAANVSGSATQSFILTIESSAPVVIYVPPTPVPFLKTLTDPQMRLTGGKLVCTAGTYQTGQTLDGVIQTSSTALFTPTSYVFNFLVNGQAQSSLTKTISSNSVQWDLSIAPSASTVSCSVTVTANSLTNTEKSTSNTTGLSAANATLAQATTDANNAYSTAQSANSTTYQKTLIDNRALWRKQVENLRANYYETLARITASGGTRKMITDKSTALKAMITAQKKSAADYKASGPAALAAKDAANKVALDAKSAAIAAANASYGTFIESIGYGVLIP